MMDQAVQKTDNTTNAKVWKFAFIFPSWLYWLMALILLFYLIV